ncbi:MAG: DUF3047 domain-containing protein [Kiloniellaceae bacterium]
MTTHPLFGGLATLALVLLAACGSQPQLAREGSYDRRDTLFDPAGAIQQGWVETPLIPEAADRRTDYRVASYQDRLSIRAEGQRSASGLVLPVDFDAEDCPYLEWDWRVERLQEGASLFEKDKDDVAASILVVFGEPGGAAATPTLRYVWTTARVPEETIVDSPSQPGVVRSIVVQGGIESPLAWESERRDLVADYQAAFGGLPEERVKAVALFTDNDQTQEPVVAHYGAARLLCRSG